MPMPRINQAAQQADRASSQTTADTSPAANTRFVAVSTSRPPQRSIIRPATGPSRPESSSAAETLP